MQKLKDIARNPLTWATTLTLIYLLILATRPSEAFFGVPGEWTWSGRPPAPSTLPRWWPAIVAIAVTAITGIVLDRHWSKLSRWQRAAALGFLVIAIPMMQVLLKYIHYRYPIEFYLYRTIGPHNGFWQVAISIESLFDYLRTYPDQMRLADDVFVHLTTHPPGTILYLWLWRKAFELLPGLAHTVAHLLRGYNCADIAFISLQDAQIAAALGQITIPLLSGLTVLPLYAWAKRLGNPQTGWRTAALFALTPSLSLFTMRWDTLYPLFAAIAFATLHRGLAERKIGWWLISGITVSLASFCSFGNAPLAPGVALYAALTLWRRGPQHIVQAWRGWLALIVGGYSVWGIFHTTTGIAFWDLLAIAEGIQTAMRASYSYASWLFHNPYHALTFVGVPIGTLFLVETIRAWKAVTRRQMTIAALPAIVTSCVLFAINVTGISPGEGGRLWLLWATGMTVAVALWSQRRPATARRRTYALLMALMALQTLWTTLFLRVSPTGMPSYTPRQPGNAVISTSLDVAFDDNIRLAGYALEPSRVAPGAEVDVVLYWQAAQRPDAPYTVFVHLIDGDGALVAQHDSMPAANDLPTSCWLPGEVVEDAHPIEIPADATPGTYTVRLGLYDLPTMERLPLTVGGADDIFHLPRTIVVTP